MIFYYPTLSVITEANLQKQNIKKVLSDISESFYHYTLLQNPPGLQVQGRQLRVRREQDEVHDQPASVQ